MGRTMLEIHTRLLEVIATMEELGTCWTLNRVANALGTSAESTLQHCKLAELHGRVQVLKKDRGAVIMPTSMANKIKE